MAEQQAVSGNIVRGIGAWSGFAASALLSAALLAALPTSAAPSTPIKLAIFDFELEDFSAGAASTGEPPADTAQLAQVTNDVRQIFAQSGRYSLVNVGSANATTATTHALHDCDGCDAPIAQKLGAEQSFVGVVKRISRTEYEVRFQIRDARTGAVVADANSGLRMGADYSWSRGAARLIKDRLMEVPGQQ